MIKKDYEIDPLLCPHCGAEMKVIAFIEDHKVIDNIIDHLKSDSKSNALLHLKSSKRNS